MIKKGGAVLIVSINVWRLVTREGIRVRIKRIEKGGGVETRKGSQIVFHASGKMQSTCRDI